MLLTTKIQSYRLQSRTAAPLASIHSEIRLKPARRLVGRVVWAVPAFPALADPAARAV
jgi:hypothetical protein